jgi:hypothetical protein
MPGSIKIDDGSGNYTILTNGGSLGSDKTITIPNETATLATTNGITEFDQWRLTANITSTSADITSNLERVDTTSQGYFGTGMTESSGIFTFPSTGYWLVRAVGCMVCTSAVSELWTVSTTDNFSTDINVCKIDGDNENGSQVNFNAISETVIDVTDTANVKVKFKTAMGVSGTPILLGNTGYNRTSFTFMKLGET